MNVMKWIRNQWDRVAAVVLIVAAGLAMLAGWLGVSRSAYPAESMPYIVSGGFFGLLLVGVAAVLWLSADLRDEWRKLDSIEQSWRDATTTVPADGVTPGRIAPGAGPARATTAR